MPNKAEVIKALNDLSSAWKKQFDRPPKTPFLWAENSDSGMVTLDNFEICSVEMINPDALFYDAEDMWIRLVDFDEIHIHIAWSFSNEVTLNIVSRRDLREKCRDYKFTPYAWTRGYVNPWAQLWAVRIHQRVKQKNDFLSCENLNRRIMALRQEFLGTGIGLTMFVRDTINNCPNIAAVEELAEYLGKRIDYYLKVLYPSNNNKDFKDLATSVMYFGLLLYAYGSVGDDKLDDLIQWAECYDNSPEVMAMVAEQDLPEDLAAECWAFVMEHEIAPNGFVDATTAALATLTGALKDPFDETV